jgi:MATE family multidrug resistance protein
MLKLALPGLIMVEAEYFAFEVLVVISAQLSTASLAAQTILATINGAFWQIPFSIGTAGTTRIAQHIGAGSISSAKLSACIVFSYTFCCSAASGIILFWLRASWPFLFTNDSEVVLLVEHTLPVVAVMHLFDGLAACCNAMLRGVGRPAFGGWTNLICYYAVALPLSLWVTFRLNWGLVGLWFGVLVALVIVVVAELCFLMTANWRKSVDDTERRNE